MLKLSLLTLGLASSLLFANVHSALVVQSSNTNTPADILGEHQSLERTWTIYSTAELQSLSFRGSVDVFVEFDEALTTDPAPPLPTPSAEGETHRAERAHSPTYPAEPSLPIEPPLPDMPEVPDLIAPPSRPSPPTTIPTPLVASTTFSVVSDGSFDSADELKTAVPTTHQVLFAVAKLVVRGDSEDLLKSFRVLASETSEDSGLQLTITGGSNLEGGYALTQLFVVKKNALSSVKVISSGDVVIGNHVLVADDSNATVKLVTVGSGDIFVASNERLSVRALEVVTAGSGDVQLQFQAVNASKAVSLTGVASGDIALLADDVTTASIKNTVVGSADLFIQAGTVAARDLNTFFGGSGSVTVSNHGTCMDETVTIAGSGGVATGGVACENVDVKIFGSGNALVQANHNLTVTLMGSGCVKYVSETPRFETITGTPFDQHLDCHVTQTNVNKFRVYKLHPVPTRSPTFYPAKEKHHRFNWWGLFGDDDSSDSNDSNDSDDRNYIDEFLDSSTQRNHPPHSKAHLRLDFSGDEKLSSASAVSFAASASSSWVSRGPSAPFAVGAFGAMVVAVGVAAYKYKQRRARHHYVPLV